MCGSNVAVNPAVMVNARIVARIFAQHVDDRPAHAGLVDQQRAPSQRRVGEQLADSCEDRRVGRSDGEALEVTNGIGALAGHVLSVKGRRFLQHRYG